MRLLHVLLDSTLVARLGMTLLHSLWQGAAVMMFLWLTLAVLRKRPATLRYALSMLSLLLLVLLPVLTFFAIEPRAGGIKPVPSASVAYDDHVASPAPKRTEVIERPAFAVSPIRTGPAYRSPPAGAVSNNSTRSYRTLLPWFAVTWLLGVTVLAVWNFAAWLATRQLCRDGTASVGAEIINRAAKLSDRLGITRTVGILSSTIARTPMVIGLLKPVILLPVSTLTELSITELESIIAHELAHVRRHDYLANLAQAVVETLLFYHPAVWWVSRQVRIEREHCCDDVVLGLMRDRTSYVTALAAIASIRVSLRPQPRAACCCPGCAACWAMPMRVPADPHAGRPDCSSAFAWRSHWCQSNFNGLPLHPTRQRHDPIRTTSSWFTVAC